MQEIDQNVTFAWINLLQSSYRQDFSVKDHTTVAHLNPQPSSSFFEIDRRTPKTLLCKIFIALMHLVSGADSMYQGTDPFAYGVVNVERRVLVQLSTPMALNFSDTR